MRAEDAEHRGDGPRGERSRGAWRTRSRGERGGGGAEGWLPGPAVMSWSEYTVRGMKDAPTDSWLYVLFVLDLPTYLHSCNNSYLVADLLCRLQVVRRTGDVVYEKRRRLGSFSTEISRNPFRLSGGSEK